MRRQSAGRVSKWEGNGKSRWREAELTSSDSKLAPSSQEKVYGSVFRSIAGQVGRNCLSHLCAQGGDPPASIPHSGSHWPGLVGLCPLHLRAVSSALMVSGPGLLSQEGRVGSLLLHRGVDDRSPPHPSVSPSICLSIHPSIYYLLTYLIFIYYLYSYLRLKTTITNSMKL